MQLTEQIRTNLVTPGDLSVITDLVQSYGYGSFFLLVSKLQFIFGKDIRPEHYIVLGLVSGYLQGAGSILAEINKQLQPCQRAN